MEQYSVSGMTCAACSAHVEKAVRGTAGVESVAVNLLTNSMNVEYAAGANESEVAAAVIAAVDKAGYGAQPKSRAKTGGAAVGAPAGELEDTETPQLKKRVISSLCFMLPLFYISMGSMFGMPLPSFLAGHENMANFALVQFLLTLPIVFINRKFFISGFKGLRHGVPNMDTLVALGGGAALVYSVWALFCINWGFGHGDHALVMQYGHSLYFEACATILTLITVGKTLEAYSKGKTTNAIKSLMNLAPKAAVLRRGDAEVTVPVEEVQLGDIFIVRPGQSIPVDGVVIEGAGAVDEAALTGESIPAEKVVGSTVSAATINQSGFLACRATRVGEDTTLAQIIHLVQDAGATKAPIAKIADKVSGVFVPAVMAIALITTAVWLALGYGVSFALSMGISVLVISCPCALGLATPVAIMVGSGVGAKNGILFKTASSLESTGKISTVVLDKTGTITNGKPVLTDIYPTEGESDETLLTLAAALEAKSEHPLAKAIMARADEDGIAYSESVNFTALPGHGLSAEINGEVAYAGNEALIREHCALPQEFADTAAQLAQQGKTPLFFARNGEFKGIIAVADTVKDTSAEAVRQMQDMGLKVVMLTGDNARTAAAIGAQVGVDSVIAEVLPADKERHVRELLESGEVAMVGDGINDAPALTRASVGIAIGAGADVAIDAADIVLMKNDLLDVPAAIRLSRKVLTNIKQNLFWAFIYNAAGIPLAAGVFYLALGWKLNPMFGAAAMSLSSFCVVSNALRLNLFSPRTAAKSGQRAEITPEIITSEKGETNMTKTMKIEGMTCGHCQARVEKTLNAIEGVSAVVELESGTANITLSADVANETLAAAVEDAGYTVVSVA